MTLDQAIAEAVAAANEPLVKEVRALRLQLERTTPPALGRYEDVQKVLGCSRSTVKAMVRDGRIQVAKHVGNSPRFDLAALRPPTDDEVAAARRTR